MTILSKNIKRMRESLNITQAELSDEFPDLSPSAVSLWEVDRSKPSLDNLVILSKIFGTTVDDLLTDDAVKATTHQKSVTKDQLISAFLAIENNKTINNQFPTWESELKAEYVLTLCAVMNGESMDENLSPKMLASLLDVNIDGIKNDEKNRPKNKPTLKAVKLDTKKGGKTKK